MMITVLMAFRVFIYAVLQSNVSSQSSTVVLMNLSPTQHFNHMLHISPKTFHINASKNKCRIVENLRNFRNVIYMLL